MNRSESVIYQTLYPEQKVFIDTLVDKKGALEKRAGTFAYGFFLKMGFGKTKLMSAMAELHDADLVLVTSIKNKILEREKRGEFPDELKAAGYTTYYSDLMGSKKYERAFLEALDRGDKIAYMFNWEQIASKKGYALLNWIVGGLATLKHRDRVEYLETEYKKYCKDVSQPQPFKEWSAQHGPNRGKGFSNIVWLLDEAQAVNNKSSAVSKLIYKMINNVSVPELKVSRENYFKARIKALYLGTGTPMTGKLYENYFWLLEILGHEWGITPVEVECYEPHTESYIDEVSGKRKLKTAEVSVGVATPPGRKEIEVYDQYRRRVVKRKQSNYEYFVGRYCEIDESARAYNPAAKVITGFKRIPELLNIVETYSFFGETSKHFDLPPIVREINWVATGYGYSEMCEPSSPEYRIFDGMIADEPAQFYLRARQLLSGFMGNSEEFKYYNLERAGALEKVLGEHPDNYIIFYHWDPELYAIIDAVKKAGYKYDIYKGELKEYETYESFQEGDTGNVIIANIASGAKALNRQRWSSVIFYSIPSVYALYEQAIGRVQRLGQKASVIKVLVFLSPFTVDERVYQSLLVGQDYTEQSFERDFLSQQDGA